MTEEEAKTKWCPKRPRYSFDVPGADGGMPDMYMCIGAKCMAWRWNFVAYTNLKTPVKTGYCGLAGKP